MANKQPIPLQWPTGGFVENSPRSAQPAGTTTDCLNVRNYDSLERRNRGGKRSGLVKVSDDPINGTNTIQNLTQVTEAVDLVQNAAWGDQYSNPSYPRFSDAFNSPRPVPLYNADGDRIMIAEDDVTRLDVLAVSGATVSNLGVAHTLDIGNHSIYSYVWNQAGTVVFIGVSENAASTVRAYPYDKTTGFGPMLDSVTLTNGGVQIFVALSPDELAVVACQQLSPYLQAWAWTGSAFGAKYADPSPAALRGPQFSYPHSLQFHPDGDFLFYPVTSGDTFAAHPFTSSGGFGAAGPFESGGGISDARSLTVHPDGTFVGGSNATFITLYPFDKSTGFGSADIFNHPDARGGYYAQFSPDGKFISGGDNGGDNANIYEFTNTIGDALPTPATLGNGAFASAWKPDGTAITWAITTNGTVDRGLATYEFVPAGLNPSARETRLVAVSGGSVYRSDTTFDNFQTVASGTAALDASAPYLDSAIAFQKLFFCDGQSANYQYLDFADNTLKDWAGGVTGGTLPQGSDDPTLGGRIICNYRGRVVLSGLREDPQNWFMSKKDDPFDWDYSPTTTTSTQAVAGNNGEAGLLGDIVTGLFPYNDDLLVMGGANTISLMTGDPADAGRIDLVTQGVGIVGPQAGCFDTIGNFYFFGANGLYQLPAGMGAQPTLLSQGKLDKTFADVDLSKTDVRLIYDPFWQGVHVFLIPSEEPTTSPTHYFWDARNAAFWPDQYPASMGPSTALMLYTDDPDNAGVIFGGYDSYIRRFADTAFSDDGTAIDSYCRFAPITPGGVMASSRLNHLVPLLDKGSEPVALNVYAGDTPEDAEDAADAGTVRFARTLRGGRNRPIWCRTAQNSFIVELAQKTTTTGTWAYEGGQALVQMLSRMRGRGV